MSDEDYVRCRSDINAIFDDTVARIREMTVQSIRELEAMRTVRLRELHERYAGAEKTARVNH